ncbi:MAG: leucine--tRNA ligase [Planctomycetes bacterium]|nr:leucine--tRNA ligase [Planctomycetota bacterium]
MTQEKDMYDFKTIESKWRKYWESQGAYKTPAGPDPARKFYLLEMFAYPSGDLHIGHFRNYTVGDAYWRYKKMAGAEIMHPFGWDAFGLPAEEAAIKQKLHPRDWTGKNIATSRQTLKDLGISYDWDREVITYTPEYYRWTQWVFLQLYKKGLAYQAESAVNWCPACKTVLANEQVSSEGVCWRCQSTVAKRNLKQWFFRITDYAQKLLDGLDKLERWPENIKAMQRYWIGRSEGTEIQFRIPQSELRIPVFTTRPDTIYGVTFMAIAPEHPLVKELTTPAQKKAVDEYIAKASAKSEIDRAAVGEKDGVFTGSFATNPLSGEQVQLWVADYVLLHYGTGVVMGVPAHDQRDFLFAKKYGIPIKIVITPHSALHTPNSEGELTAAFTEPGIMVNSAQFNGLPSEDGISKISQHIEKQKLGSRKIYFRLKDWLLSRQRYWGAPIPMIHCPKCGPQPVPESDLPVLLPEVKDYIPKGRSPLADVPEFMNAKCPKCKGPAQRDPDTMDTFVCSSWYHLRYADPRNTKEPFTKEAVNKWLPVDLYIGGAEHACGHLIYFRFITKVLHDLGYLKIDEPVKRLFNHGMVLDAQGEVMSKSKGNAVSPREIIEDFGVDAGRLAMFFAAPSEAEILWSKNGLIGAQRFLNRVHQLVLEVVQFPVDDTRGTKKMVAMAEMDEFYAWVHRTIKQVTEDIEALHYNTALSAIMELVNHLYEVKALLKHPTRAADYAAFKGLLRKAVESVVMLLSPLAPHLAEEMWSVLGKKTGILAEPWPQYNPAALKLKQVELAIQINGKVRARITVATDSAEDEIKKVALADPKVKEILQGQEPKKVIVIPGRLVNIVYTERSERVS